MLGGSETIVFGLDLDKNDPSECNPVGKSYLYHQSGLELRLKVCQQSKFKFDFRFYLKFLGFIETPVCDFKLTHAQVSGFCMIPKTPRKSASFMFSLVCFTLSLPSFGERLQFSSREGSMKLFIKYVLRDLWLLQVEQQRETS